jgi:uncharacterized membrane protein
MQAINVVAINRSFLGAFSVTAAACAVLAVASLLSWPEPGALFLLVGSTLYLVGTILVTIAFNVPLNDALAAVEPASAEGVSLWDRYSPAGPPGTTCERPLPSWRRQRS